ncbi:junctional adhesion molecule 2A isoform X8 [Takifugu flavidus]|uniref:junctional adhesion molecule 2A isoform X8 n=1 Tax=Takifugu flavidus TaxID=433684 RepID=UPI0025448083|nr:junctional adhesion molecule 2A isoform X8 [Takifugu flavidus]
MIMEGASLYLPFVILLMQCSSCVPVVVSTNRHTVEVREDTDAVLSCVFHTEKEQNPRIEWKKKGKDVSFVYFDGHFRGSFEGRASIEGATVTLRRVTQEDAGEYRCEISAPLDTVTLGETNVTLKVLVPPHTPSCEVPSAAVTGSVVQLRCSDQQSVPPATYSWFKDNQPISTPRYANATYVINSHTGILKMSTSRRWRRRRRWSAWWWWRACAGGSCSTAAASLAQDTEEGHFGSLIVTVEPISAAKTCTELKKCPTSTMSLLPKNPRILNTPSHSCSEKLAFLSEDFTCGIKVPILDTIFLVVLDSE